MMIYLFIYFQSSPVISSHKKGDKNKIV